MVRDNQNADMLRKAELIKDAMIFLSIELGRRPSQVEIQNYVNKAMHKRLSRNDINRIISHNERGGIYQ